MAHVPADGDEVTARLHIARVSADGVHWTDLGETADFVMERDGDTLVNAEPVSLIPTGSVTLAVDLAGDTSWLHHLIPGPGQRRPGMYRIEADWQTPTIGPAPVKARRLTGKAYRIARRRYARARKAWLAAGSPMTERRIVIPQGSVQ